MHVFVSSLAEGGNGKQGSVLSVGDASNASSHRSWVKIRWDAGGTNDYQRGHQGSLDVKCVTPAKGEMYYVTHLPKLGNCERLCWTVSHRNNISFNIGLFIIIIAI